MLDYKRRTLTLAEPRAVRPAGIRVPFRLNRKTGLISVDISIKGQLYSVTIDNGSAYTWLRKDIVQGWLKVEPQWEKGSSAVGLSNMRMEDDGIEASGILVRIPEMRLGSLRLHQIGALAIGPSRTGWNFMEWYSRKNAVPVIGWLGGNVLQAFRITIDYQNRVSYWMQQLEGTPHDLDQVGLSLVSKGGKYFVSAIATQNGKATVDGVQVGDQLLEIDGLNTKGTTSSEILSALHGMPGELRSLRLERNGQQFAVTA